MFFGIALTPKQFLIAFLGAGFLSFIFLMPAIFGTTPSQLDSFPNRIAELNKDYEDAIAESEKIVKLGKSAILGTKVEQLKISGSSNIAVSEEITVKNIIDHPVVRGRIQLYYHSDLLNNCVVTGEWNFTLDEPLLPGDSITLERQWRTHLAGQHLIDKHYGQSPACDRFNVAGNHKVSKVEAFVVHYYYNDFRKSTQPLPYMVTPKSGGRGAGAHIKEKLDYCAEVIALMDKGKFTDDDIEDHSLCFNKLGYHSQSKTFRERLAE